MNWHDFGWLIVGIVFGWVTKIPIFLRQYKAWKIERDAIRKWMKMHDDAS